MTTVAGKQSSIKDVIINTAAGVPVDAAHPLPVEIDSLGGAVTVNVANADFAGIGLPADAAWDLASAASAVSILKKLATQLLGHAAVIATNFTRPADTTAYASGDLIANNVTAGSVVPMSFAVARVAGYGGMIRRARLRKTGTSITNAQFRLHFYTQLPTPSNGDNGAWLTDKCINYQGKIDVTCDEVFTDGASGNGVPYNGSEINFSVDTVYVLVEARAAYTPVSGEVFTVELELVQN